jgi:DNA-binding response OmpR family regulator
LNELYISSNITEELKTNIIHKMNNKKLLIKSYDLNSLEKKDKDIVVLEIGFYFDLKKEKLFLNNNEIHLTLKEYKLFKLLIKNLNNITKIEDIELLVWEKRKFTRSSLRSYVNRLRNKIYPELIMNKSNIGYKMVGNKN